MHVNIIQFSLCPFTSDDDIMTVDNLKFNPEAIREYSYAYELKPKVRLYVIKLFVEHILPAGMFTLNEDGESARYCGGMDGWRSKYAEIIQGSASVAMGSNVLDAWGDFRYDLEETLRNPLRTDTFFMQDNEANFSLMFMRAVDTMRPGENVYFGNVLGCKL